MSVELPGDPRVVHAVQAARKNCHHTRPIHTADIAAALKAADEHDQREWSHLNSALAQRLTFAVEAENYPAAVENASKIATVLWRAGMLYAINTAVLHALGLAMGINSAERSEGEGEAVPYATGLFLAGTDDPEGITFDEEGHAEGIAKVHDVALPILVSSLEAAHERFARELKRRQMAKSGQSELDVHGDAPNGA